MFYLARVLVRERFRCDDFAGLVFLGKGLGFRI